MMMTPAMRMQNKYWIRSEKTSDNAILSHPRSEHSIIVQLLKLELERQIVGAAARNFSKKFD